MTISFGRALLLVACFASAPAGAQADEPTLSVELAVTSENSRLEARDASSHFHVVIRNISSAAQRVWEDWNSWGYFALSFEISDESGKHWIAAKRKEIVFTRNFPSFETIDPGNVLVVDVYLGDDKTWAGFPLQKGQLKKVQLRATYEVRDSPEAKEMHVWTGRIKSKAAEVTFVRWK